MVEGDAPISLDSFKRTGKIQHIAPPSSFANPPTESAASPTVQEIKQVAPEISYRSSISHWKGYTEHHVEARYGSPKERGAQLADIRYKDGNPYSISIKFGDKDTLLQKTREQKNRGFRFGGHPSLARPTHEGSSIAINDDGTIEVYDDINDILGEVVAHTQFGETVTSDRIPYAFETSRENGKITVRRIGPNGGSTWEFNAPDHLDNLLKEDVPITLITD